MHVVAAIPFFNSHKELATNIVTLMAMMSCSQCEKLPQIITMDYKNLCKQYVKSQFRWKL